MIALVVSVAAYAMAGLGLKGRAPRDIVVYAVVFCGAFVAGWLVVRFTAPRADPVLYPTATVLAGLGIAMLYRIMVARGESTVAREQAIWLLVGLAAFCATLWFVRDDRQLNAYTYTIGLIGVVLLLLPVLPNVPPIGGGREINGARLWAEIGPFSFQPAEFGKIFIVVFLASYLTDKQELLAAGSGRFGLPRAKDLGPLLLAWGASLAVLFLERDLGASLLFFGVFVVMLWVASGRAAYLWIGLVLFASGAWIGYLALDHVQARVDTWLHALDPGKVTGTGYFQLAQGWFAMATGGIVGTGLGQGSPTLIPYVGSDFIFAAFGEELGMIGAVALLLLYLILIARGLRDRDGAHRHVREAARHRPHDDPRAADVRDRGRRDAADPAHRRAAAARELRRVEPGRDVRDARAADPGVVRADGALAWIGASAGSASGSWPCSRCCSRSSPYVQVFRGRRDQGAARERAPPDHRRVPGRARADPLGRRGGARQERSERGPAGRAAVPTGVPRRTPLRRDSPGTTRASTAGPSSSRRRTPTCPATPRSSRSRRSPT